MSTEKPKIVEIEVIDNDVDLTITMNSFMYHRLQRLLLSGFDFKDMQEFGETVNRIKEGKSELEPRAYHVETILLLINLLEDSAKANKKTHMAKIDTSTGKEIKD